MAFTSALYVSAETSEETTSESFDITIKSDSITESTTDFIIETDTESITEWIPETYTEPVEELLSEPQTTLNEYSNTNVYNFIERMYRIVLGREADPQGIKI